VLAALTLAAGMERSAHAQGGLNVFPQPNGAVFLTWLASPDPGLVGYNVYRREAGVAVDKAALVNPQAMTATTLLDAGPDGKGLPLGKPVLYFIRAVFKDAAGKLSEGTNSAQAVATPQNPIVIPAGSFFYYDIDTDDPSTVTRDGDVLTIRASGPPLWEKNDGNTFFATAVAGDYQLTARVEENPVNVDPDNGAGNAKAGIEIRSSLLRVEPGAWIHPSVNRDPTVWFEGRKASIGGDQVFSFSGASMSEAKYPLYLRLVKAGATITAFQSLDGGKTFAQVGDPQDFGTLPPVTYAGIFVSADKEGQSTIGKFDLNSIEIKPK
jgi:hypothetical protein